MVIDEGHRMKNHQSKLSQTLTQHYTTLRRLLLTGTPLQNNLPELWSLLNFLLPTIFKSMANFEEWFNSPFAGSNETLELSDEEKMLVIRKLHKVLRPFLLRRLKKDVETQLPDKVEHILKVEMSALQRQLYKQMHNTIVQLRKICNHPFLFQEVEQDFSTHVHQKPIAIQDVDLWRVAGKFELLTRMLPKLKATGHRVLIFCQMTSLITILEDFFPLIQIRSMRLDGATKADERASLLQQFNAADSDYDVFVLSTRAGGLGLNLQTADTVIIFDSDWNPHQDLQAQDRAHRIGQQNEVRVFRFVTVHSVEESILEAARFKLDVDQKVIQAGMFSGQKVDAKVRQDYLKQLLENERVDDDDDDGEEESETVTYQQLNRMMARNEEELQTYNRMDEEMNENDKHWQNERRQQRLVAMSELPKHFVDDRFVKSVSDSIKGKTVEPLAAHRKRRTVNYADELTEEQWLAKVESGDMAEELEAEHAAKRSKLDLENTDSQDGMRLSFTAALRGDENTNDGLGTESEAPK
ncbi:uncharacterized protein MONBRDRAFT_38516, partial [Monosiga brevicollis MX1]